MGEVRIQGPRALESLQWMTSNDVSKIPSGRAQYNLLMNERGGVVDDLIVYCLTPGTHYLAVVNAANVEKDFEWMKAHNKGASLTDESSEWAQIAVQGPSAKALVAQVLGDRGGAIGWEAMPPFHFGEASFEGHSVIACSTGYTGEEGFELLIGAPHAVALWRELLRAGESLGAAPIGLGARDTLRTDMKHSLYGHEINDDTNPIEAGLVWVVKPQKGDFVGRAPVVRMQEEGPRRKLVGFKMIDKGIPRAEYGLLSFDKKKIGGVTSGTLSPTLNEGIGIGYVEAGFAAEGTEILVDIRGRPARAKVVKTPFVSTGLTARGAKK
jgi:aminomethyltransferase